jgi:hypothetical protein
LKRTKLFGKKGIAQVKRESMVGLGEAERELKVLGFGAEE